MKVPPKELLQARTEPVRPVGASPIPAITKVVNSAFRRSGEVAHLPAYFLVRPALAIGSVAGRRRLPAPSAVAPDPHNRLPLPSQREGSHPNWTLRIAGGCALALFVPNVVAAQVLLLAGFHVIPMPDSAALANFNPSFALQNFDKIDPAALGLIETIAALSPFHYRSARKAVRNLAKEALKKDDRALDRLNQGARFLGFGLGRHAAALAAVSSVASTLFLHDGVKGAWLFFAAAGLWGMKRTSRWVAQTLERGGREALEQALVPVKTPSKVAAPALVSGPAATASALPTVQIPAWAPQPTPSPVATNVSLDSRATDI